MFFALRTHGYGLWCSRARSRMAGSFRVISTRSARALRWYTDHEFSNIALTGLAHIFGSTFSFQYLGHPIPVLRSGGRALDVCNFSPKFPPPIFNLFKRGICGRSSKRAVYILYGGPIVLQSQERIARGNHVILIPTWLLFSFHFPPTGSLVISAFGGCAGLTMQLTLKCSTTSYRCP